MATTTVGTDAALRLSQPPPQYIVTDETATRRELVETHAQLQAQITALAARILARGG